MKTTKASLLAGVLALLGLTIVSCESIHDPHATNAQNAVMCDKCKTIFLLNAIPGYGLGGYGLRGHGLRGYGGGGQFIIYRPTKAMTCPDCESAVTHFLKTGQLQHHCARCGGTMTCGTAQ